MDRFDPTQCACANDMSNRLIAICKIIWRHAKRDSSVGTTVSDGQRIFEPSRSFDPVTRNIRNEPIRHVLCAGALCRAKPNPLSCANTLCAPTAHVHTTCQFDQPGS